jgi:hypothetical protein
MTATPAPSNMWGIFGMILIFILGIALYLTLSYFYKEYKKATGPLITIEEVEDEPTQV